jgi:EAL domain-containing protein (putative c-di-GMP-specific phosphodiesterase class I)
VERQAELDVVMGLGIHLVQGYLLCPPLAVSALEERDVFEGASGAENRPLAFEATDN